MFSETVSLYRVPLKNLLDYVNPFVTPPWNCPPFTVEHVKEYADLGHCESMPTPSWYTQKAHIARIAHFVVNGWDNGHYPPHLDVGIPGLSPGAFWPIDDGNHRVCAAVVREDKYINMAISGSLSHAEELLGVRLDY